MGRSQGSCFVRRASGGRVADGLCWSGPQCPSDYGDNEERVISPGPPSSFVSVASFYMHTAGQEAARAGCEYDYFGFKTLERSCLLRRTGSSSSAHSTR